MIDSFKIPASSVQRNYALYIILCKPTTKRIDMKPILLYVGKTGDKWNVS